MTAVAGLPRPVRNPVRPGTVLRLPETEGQELAQHRSPGGQQPSPILLEESPEHSPGERGTHRIPAPPSVFRGRLVVAAVAAGAFVAAGQSMATGEEAHPNTGKDDTHPAFGLATSASFGTVAAEDSLNSMGGAAPAPEVLPAVKIPDTSAEVQKLAKSERISKERARTAAEANRPKFVRPAEGQFTSGFGGRWGSTHYGIDFANSKGTPIVSAADGEVIEAGAASGFGMWVRVQHDDGTITVYGHVNTITAHEGEEVRAGEQIATMGNRGFSTGTHLHFEVWNPSGKKINPAPWLEEHGIEVS